MSDERKQIMCVVRQWHETVNRRMKQWQILKGDFRHDINLHHISFTAVAVVTHVAISNEESLFQVDYTNNLDVSDEEDEMINEDESDSGDDDDDFN